MARVLVTDKINDLAVEIVSKAAQADNLPTMDEDKLCEIIGQYDAILIRSQTKITPKIIDHAKNLKVIARAGVGVDNVDLKSAGAKGILVVNSPDGNTHAAAEHTIAMMMAMNRNIPIANSSIKQGLWERSKFMGVEVFGKILGIIGFGKIGSYVSKIAMALGMKVVVYDSRAKDRVEKFGAVHIPNLDDFWNLCDFISIHAPKTEETTNLINETSISKMKKGVRIINCARGGIIDEYALARAIENKQVAQCAIDVFADEKNISSSPLLKFDKEVILTPHLGASIYEAQINVALDAARQVVNVIEGKEVSNVVNKSFLKNIKH